MVIGVERQPGQAPFALLAREVDGKFLSAGSAFVALGGTEGELIWSGAVDLASDKAPLKELAGRDAQWLSPEIPVRVRQLKGGDKLRHATVSGVLDWMGCG